MGGEAAHHNFPREFLEKASLREKQVLDYAESKYGKNDEIDFWRRYFLFIGLGEDEAIMEKHRFNHSKSLIPYFYLFMSGGGESYQHQAQEVYNSVRKGLTAKERYIKSVLDSNVIPDQYKPWLTQGV